jgi:ABC-2 type transport system ATP-binding protein
MDTVLSVADARKTYRSNPPTLALDGANMRLQQGEWLALLGPNGAGKTTLIKAVAGRVKLDGGAITLLGRLLDASGDPPDDVARGQLGIVPQDLALYPLLTAAENMSVFGSLHGVPREQLKERVRWALEWTGLVDRADSLTKTFSGGMKRRLNIACGVLHRPKVVLLDEPTVGVDPQSRERIWHMLSQLRDEGASLLLTTHQLDEAQQICDRITIIDHGRTIADGTVEELVTRTIGRGRRVTLVFDRAAEDGAHRCAAALGLELLDGDQAGGRVNIEDVAAELPPLLERVRASGRRVLDVRIEPPTLQAVFIHLTGRELRE